MNEDVGFGFIGACIAIFCLWFVFSLGEGAAEKTIAGECANFGKTQIKGKWYECKLQ